MSYWQAIVLGVVQGLTEFLPVSSSGHLVVTEAAVGLAIPGVVVEVTLHVATLVAVIIVYRARLVELIRGVARNDAAAWRSVGLLAIGTIPAGIIGGLFAGYVEQAFDALLIVGIDFVVTGTILWSTRPVLQRASRPEPSVGGAIGIGLAQAFAILPGISRSGSTVAAGLWLRVEPVQAAEFSFLLAIPAIAGAAVLELPKLASEGTMIGVGPLLAGAAAALVSGVWAIRLLVRLLRRGTFHHFAPYCWAIGGVTIVWALLR